MQENLTKLSLSANRIEHLAHTARLLKFSTVSNFDPKTKLACYTALYSHIDTELQEYTETVEALLSDLEALQQSLQSELEELNS